MLSLYLDDSGSQDIGPVFVMGGFISDERRWKKFEDQWALALKDAKISAFHATDFYTRQIEPFKSWTKETHAKFSRRFTAIAARHTAAGISRAVDVSAYSEIVLPESDLILPKAWRASNLQRYRLLPIMFCTRVCLEWIARWPGRPRSEPIAVVFDGGTYGLGATIEFCRFLQRNTLWARPYASFTDANKSLVLPLQAADLMAWLSHKELTKEMRLPGQPTHKALRRVSEEKRISVSVGTRRSLSVFIGELKRFRESLGETP